MQALGSLSNMAKPLSIISLSFVACIYLYVGGWVSRSMSYHKSSQRSKGKWRESVLSFLSVGPGDRTQEVSLGSRPAVRLVLQDLGSFILH